MRGEPEHIKRGWTEVQPYLICFDFGLARRGATCQERRRSGITNHVSSHCFSDFLHPKNGVIQVFICLLYWADIQQNGVSFFP